MEEMVVAMKRGRAKGRAARDAAEARGVRERIDGFSPEKEAIFLAELEKSGCMSDACRVADISRTSVQRHRRHRPAFDSACRLARVKSRGPLEAIAWMRAVEGTPTRIIRGGKVVEERIRPSDAMLKTLMEGADPAKYGRKGGATPAQIEAIRQEMEAEREEESEARKEEAVRRILRKLHVLRRRMLRQGCGMTVEGDLVPPGYGPVSPDAVPMMEDPLAYDSRQDWADFKARGEEEERRERERGLG
jgi:hypothetical protein